ncbi:MAG: PorT family protein [Bacteroidales bacterium]|nr:PorT family protein [Bacteroidales bacterium]
MKKLSIFTVLILFTYGLNAQNFGVKAGYNITGYTTNFDVPEESQPGMGYNLGVFAEMPVNDMIGIRADASVNQLGSDAVYEGTDWKSVAKTNVNYLSFSLISKFNYGIFYGFAGPYMGYALSKKTKYVSTFNGETVKETYNDYEYYEQNGTLDFNNRIDLGINIGVGANLYSAFFADINIGFGIASMYNKNSDTYQAYLDEATLINESNLDATIYGFPFTDGTQAVANPVQKNIFFGLTVGYVIGGH